MFIAVYHEYDRLFTVSRRTLEDLRLVESELEDEALLEPTSELELVAEFQHVGWLGLETLTEPAYLEPWDGSYVDCDADEIPW